MIAAFCATVNDITTTSIRGNGKTCSMTATGYFAHCNGQKIYSNYSTTFSEEVLGLQAIIDRIKLNAIKVRDGKLKVSPFQNSMLLISEMQKILNSIGSTQGEVLFIEAFCSEIRKHDLDLCYDTQRFNNIHKRLRLHTDVVFIPFKYHMDNSPCNFDRCKKPHKIYLYKYDPTVYHAKPVKIYDATIVGKLYNSKEFILDNLKIPKKNKITGEIEE